MSKFWIIFKLEYAQIVKKKSFLIGLVITPVFLFGMMFGPALLAKKKSTSTEYMAVIDQSELQIGQEFKDKLSDYKLEDSTTPYYNIEEFYEIPEYEEERFTQINDSLKKLILENELKYLIVITPDAISSDSGVYIISSADNIVSYQRFEWQLSRVISTKRLEMSEINLPVDSVLQLTSRIDLVNKDVKGETTSIDQKLMVGIVFVMMIYMLILINGQMVMRSVIDEKNSRIMEVLVSSVSPFQLMMGKILGLGSATLTQVVIWILAAAGIMFFGSGMIGDTSSLSNLAFNPIILVYFFLYFILGFLLYSTLFALLGSVVENEKDAQQFMIPIVIFLVVPVVLIMLILQEPNGTLPTVLSFIPLFTPTMMVMRLNIVVPGLPEYDFFSGVLLQANLSVILLAASVIGMIWLTAKVFRVGILMYGKRATLPEIIKWVKH